MVRKQPNRLTWVVGSFFVLVGACSIVAEVDRENIPSNETPSTGGSGGTGGAGGAGGTGGVGATGGSGGAGGCTVPSDCPGTDTDCASRTCVGNSCGVEYAAAGTLTSQQVEGDCQSLVCDGSGSTIKVNDDKDIPAQDNECAVGSCVAGAPKVDFAPEGTECSSNGGNVCDGEGACVECMKASDCPNNDDLCVDKQCVPASCGNQKLDPGETDVDCGGPDCAPCADGLKCLEGDDCKSGVCNATAKTCSAPACDDKVKNGSETDVDCGGSCPNGCAAGKACKENGDCKGGQCDANQCQPTCTDEEKNGTETDVDCGGSCATKCDTGKACANHGDCASGSCENNVCKAADACKNHVKDGDETDVDCGGPVCDKCVDGKACLVDGDCVNYCAATTKECVKSHCEDEKKSGDETDVDCGGSCSTKCNDGQACANNDDCASGNCDNKECKPADACKNNKQDGDETDVDCGGPVCDKCV
ncbi:MAG TPA: hypothetical protein PLM08_19970, partial [Polyangiaceae bacterium]|nr:hypothetical protein [Polyangiaceae bacterium]